LVPVLFTFYIQVVLKLKKNNSVAKRLTGSVLKGKVLTAHAMETCRRNGGIYPLILNLSDRWRGEWSSSGPAALLPAKEVIGMGVWVDPRTGMEIPGFEHRIMQLVALSKYQLRYPGSQG
jgi:hypothetical protein